MSHDSSVWYVQGTGNQPMGPFTAQQIIDACQAGQLAATALCWRAGMADWLPLGRVQPFAAIPSPASFMPPPISSYPQNASSIRHPRQKTRSTFAAFFSGTMGIGCALMMIPLLFVGGCLAMVGSCTKSMLPDPPRKKVKVPGNDLLFQIRDYFNEGMSELEQGTPDPHEEAADPPVAPSAPSSQSSLERSPSSFSFPKNEAETVPRTSEKPRLPMDLSRHTNDRGLELNFHKH